MGYCICLLGMVSFFAGPEQDSQGRRADEPALTNLVNRLAGPVLVVDVEKGGLEKDLGLSRHTLNSMGGFISAQFRLLPRGKIRGYDKWREVGEILAANEGDYEGSHQSDRVLLCAISAARNGGRGYCNLLRLDGSNDSWSKSWGNIKCERWDENREVARLVSDAFDVLTDKWSPEEILNTPLRLGYRNGKWVFSREGLNGKVFLRFGLPGTGEGLQDDPRKAGIKPGVFHDASTVKAPPKFKGPGCFYDVIQPHSETREELYSSLGDVLGTLNTYGTRFFPAEGCDLDTTTLGALFKKVVVSSSALSSETEEQSPAQVLSELASRLIWAGIRPDEFPVVEDVHPSVGKGARPVVTGSSALKSGFVVVIEALGFPDSLDCEVYLARIMGGLKFEEQDKTVKTDGLLLERLDHPDDAYSDNRDTSRMCVGDPSIDALNKQAAELLDSLKFLYQAQIGVSDKSFPPALDFTYNSNFTGDLSRPSQSPTPLSERTPVFNPSCNLSFNPWCLQFKWNEFSGTVLIREVQGWNSLCSGPGYVRDAQRINLRQPDAKMTGRQFKLAEGLTEAAFPELTGLLHTEHCQTSGVGGFLLIKQNQAEAEKFEWPASKGGDNVTPAWFLLIGIDLASRELQDVMLAQVIATARVDGAENTPELLLKNIASQPASADLKIAATALLGKIFGNGDEQNIPSLDFRYDSEIPASESQESLCGVSSGAWALGVCIEDKSSVVAEPVAARIASRCYSDSCDIQ